MISRKGGREGRFSHRLGNTGLVVDVVEGVKDFVIADRDSIGNARGLTEAFHGRRVRDVKDIVEEWEHPSNLAGEEKVLAIMKANKAFWNQVAMVAKPEEIKQFVHEFVNCEALDADEGDVEEDEEEAIAVPKVAANGSGDKGKRVGRQS